MTNEELQLGMGRSISRRDFINGVAVTGVGLAANSLGLPALAAGADYQPVVSPAYPPLNTGLRGNLVPAIADFPDIQAGKYKTFPVANDAITEEYDLVVVGGGISGLSAALFYQRGLGTDEKILVIDNNDDFGGHAKRNEFHIGDKTLISYGGTMGIATPFPYSYMAKSVLMELGIKVSRSSELTNHILETKYHLGNGTFFDKETYGEDKFVVGNARGRAAATGFYAKTPLNPKAQADLVRINGKNPDYMPGMTEEVKIEKLKRMSYKDFLANYAKVDPQVLIFMKNNSGRNNKFIDTMPAYEAGTHGNPGFNGLGLKFEEQYSEGSFTFHFPDGNASVARLLISKIVPPAFAQQPQTMDTIVNAKLDYSALDKAENPIRVRLSAPVVRVMLEGTAEKSSGVKIAYHKDGKLQAVRAKYVVMACYNRILPDLIPELPVTQKKALLNNVKVPMMYTSVVIKNWTAFQKLGVSRINCPNMYYGNIGIDTGNLVGGYQAVGDPTEPVVIHLSKSPNHPGLPNRKDQNAAGRDELLKMTFADHELIIRKQFQRALGAGGFNAADDILAITVNRWPYGYAYTYDTLNDPDMPEEQRPHVLGRARFGRITIANSDAAAAAFTNAAMDEANRAVEEIWLTQGLR